MGKFNQLEQAISDTLDDAFGDAQKAEVIMDGYGHDAEAVLMEIPNGEGDCIPNSAIPALKADIMKRLKEILS